MITRPGRLAGLVLSLALLATGCSSTDSRGATGPEGERVPGTAAMSSPAPAPQGPPAPQEWTTGSVTAWAQASGDARRSSATTAAGPTRGTVRWTRTLEGAVAPGAAVGTDGSVLIASNGGVLHALDPATGRDRWTFAGGGRYGSDLSTTAAVLTDGTILWPAPGRRLVALTAGGEQRWEQQMSGFVLSPAVVGNRAYVADQRGRVLALDLADTGRPRVAWTLEVGGTSYGSPAVAPDGTVYTTTGSELVAITDRGDAAAQAWRFRARDTVEVSPAVTADGTVILGTNGDDQIGVGPDGRERWRFAKGDWSYSSPVARDGLAYFGDHLGFLDVVDSRTGALVRRQLGIPKEQGRTSAGTGVWTAPLVDAAGRTYFGTAAGHVYGYDAEGQRLFDVVTGATVASYPALTADGTLVIGAQNGTVYAIKD